MSRGGLLRTEYVIGIPLDNFINSISLYKFILILQKRKLRIRRLKGYTRSCSSEGVGCDWHPVCLTANLVLILLHHSLSASVPTQRAGLLGQGHQTASGNKFME